MPTHPPVPGPPARQRKEGRGLPRLRPHLESGVPTQHARAPRPGPRGRNAVALRTLLALAAAAILPLPLTLTLPHALAGQATQTAPTAPTAHPAASEAHIRSLEAEESRALVARDRATLSRLWAPDFTVNAPRNVVVQGRDGVLTLLDNGVLDYAQFERNIDVVRIDGDMALVMGSETVHPRGSAPMAGHVVQRRYTNIWRLRGGEWVQVARHAHVVTGG